MSKELEDLDCGEEVKTKYGVCYAYSPDVVEEFRQALQRLEAIDNSKASEALEKLEMLSDCAEAMKEAPSSNWIEYANNETELDYQLWIAYEDLKQYILKSQEQEKVLKILKERQVNIALLVSVRDVEEYNFYIPYEEFEKYLTQDEFDLLKRWVGCQKNQKLN